MLKVEVLEMKIITRKLKMTIALHMSNSGKKIPFSMNRFRNCFQGWNQLKKMSTSLVLIVPMIQNRIMSTKISFPGIKYYGQIKVFSSFQFLQPNFQKLKLDLIY